MYFLIDNSDKYKLCIRYNNITKNQLKLMSKNTISMQTPKCKKSFVDKISK